MLRTERKRASKVEGEQEDTEENAYDPHECEYCGKVLPDPGLSFLRHLEESETCYFLWHAYLPYVHEDAGAD